MGLYPKEPFEKGAATAVLKSQRFSDKPVYVRRMLPGNVILVHGVNDVGTSYAAVEAGLCDGLRDRLNRTFQAATYKQPGAADKGVLLDDPDAVFYKRDVGKAIDSPVIPFYWGYRELDGKSKNIRGQMTDRYGNRLDKDLSKGGGPFANATSNLPDMWNKGFGTPVDLDIDPIRPLCDAPGRMYMVLAASRLMALISMIRDYDEKETVTVIAHSQGCLLTLLAQAMLAEKGLRPADTLILTHPPYSLVEEAEHRVTKGASKFHGGEDDVMKPFYGAISSMQSLHGRLQTLINIVGRVADPMRAPAEPKFATLADHKVHDGVVGGLWKAEADRDNRGKVYLYFCPQDMTVALDNMQGIGWQGVPDSIEGTRVRMVPETTRAGGRGQGSRVPTGRMVPLRDRGPSLALAMLGEGFYQRVFSNKLRPDPATGKPGPVMLGWSPPYDYILRLKGEDDHAHVEDSVRTLRAHFPVATWPVDPHGTFAEQRNGIRKITGEALRAPVVPVLANAAETLPENLPKGSPQARLKPEQRGPCEDVDPLDAENAVTCDSGMWRWMEARPDPRIRPDVSAQDLADFKLTQDELKQMTAAYNQEKNLVGDNQRTIVKAGYVGANLMAIVEESPNEARLRWQRALSAKSFHGAIIGNRENHRQVTAYDVAIGQGTAATDPKFYSYLCAVADWRLKKPRNNDKFRAGIPKWNEFLYMFSSFFAKEPKWRSELIEGNSTYYSTGILPDGLPLLTGRLWEIIISDAVNGVQVLANPRPRT